MQGVVTLRDVVNYWRVIVSIVAFEFLGAFVGAMTSRGEITPTGIIVGSAIGSLIGTGAGVLLHARDPGRLRKTNWYLAGFFIVMLLFFPLFAFLALFG